MTDTTLSPTDRLDRAARIIASDGLIQNAWHKTADDGRELACMLGAFGDDIKSPRSCPADLMPEWMAELIPTMFDGLPADQIYPFAGRFVPALRGMMGATDAQWRTVQVDVLLASLAIALPHDLASIVQPVIGLLIREKAGEKISPEEWEAAWEAAAWEAAAAAAALTAARDGLNWAKAYLAETGRQSVTVEVATDKVDAAIAALRGKS